MKRLMLIFSAVCLTCSAGAQDTSKDEGSFLKRNPSAKSVHWKEDGNKVMIRLKSGKTETYDLSNERERNALTARYGSLPAAPPPPPPVQPSVPPTLEEPAPPPPPPVAPPPPPKVKKCGTEPMLCSPPLPVYHQ